VPDMHSDAILLSRASSQFTSNTGVSDQFSETPDICCQNNCNFFRQICSAIMIVVIKWRKEGNEHDGK